MIRVAVFVSLLAAGCNPRPVACSLTAGPVDPSSARKEIPRCRIDQVCCRYGEGNYGCGEPRQAACIPQQSFTAK